MEVKVEYVSAGDTAARLAEGSAHMGITGEDLLAKKSRFQQAIHLVSPLGFGQADAVVAIPDGWVDVTTMNDPLMSPPNSERETGDARVATKCSSHY